MDLLFCVINETFSQYFCVRRTPLPSTHRIFAPDIRVEDIPLKNMCIDASLRFGSTFCLVHLQLLFACACIAYNNLNIFLNQHKHRCCTCPPAPGCPTLHAPFLPFDFSGDAALQSCGHGCKNSTLHNYRAQMLSGASMRASRILHPNLVRWRSS